MSRPGFTRYFYRFDVIAFLCSVLVFTIWPTIDLNFSALMFDGELGGFFWKDVVFVGFIYQLASVIGIILVFGLPLIIVVSWLTKINYLVQRRKLFIFLLCSCILGPGVMVNLMLKDNWERPRPRQTIEFGGGQVYEPPFAPKYDCKTCYSFVSGHASVGFYFFAIALFMRRRRWLLLPIMAGGFFGGVRVVQGAHYLSDVIFSGWLVWFTSLFLYVLFYKVSSVPWRMPIPVFRW